MNAPTRALPAIIAHRGASALAPENTVAAFEKAIELGADFFELDVQMTRDGGLAVFHDRDISRFTNKNTAVVDLLMKEMRLVDVGSWFDVAYSSERVISLDEALALAAGRIGVYIEVKSAQDETPRVPDMLEVLDDASSLGEWKTRYLLDAVNRISADSVVMARSVIDVVRKWQDRCTIVVQSFSPVVAFILISEAPEIRFEFLGMDLPEPPNIWRHILLFGERMGVSGFNVNKESLDAERLHHFHDMGCSCAVWVVDEPAQMRQYRDMGVDAIITNTPDVCRAALVEDVSARRGEQETRS